MIILSFYLDGIFSRMFTTLFTLMSLIIIYPYMYNKKSYYKLCFIIGLIYDIVYTNTLFLNASIFLLIGIIISKIKLYNIIKTEIVSILVIIIYRLITFLVLVFINYLNFDTNILINSIKYSILVNIIYVLIIYIVLKKVINKKY